MDAQLKQIKGPTPGEVFSLGRGETVLGKGGRAGVRIVSEGVSWEHATITRTEDDFYLENLSAFGTLLNDNKIAGKTRLRPRDKIELAPDVVLQFLVSDAGGLLKNRTLLITGLGSVILVVMMLMLFNPFRDQSGPPDWAHWKLAYATLAEWLDGQVAKSNLPPEAAFLFKDGFRLCDAKNYALARDRYLSLQLLLVKQTNYVEASDVEPRALDHMLSPPVGSASTQPVEDQVRAAAVAQFTTKMLQFTSKNAGSSGP